MKKLLLVLLFLPYLSWSNSDIKIPRVPSHVEFAGMNLKLTDAARKIIQKDVDALRKSPKFFQIKADRAKMYFPIIERVLKEEKVPEDFKYLALQESGLISDAVSSANAVGFWQFKDFTGREVGLRIDRSIDERLNVVSSTHGAAKYFKRHNFFFDNWVYCVLAHMTGRGGAEKYTDKSNFGKKRMTLDKNIHWYVARFLAHKIAFEGEVDGKHSEGMSLQEYAKGKGKSLEQIAKTTKSDLSEIKKYNKWLKHGKVPGDKTYVVIIPGKGKVKKSDKPKPNVEEVVSTDEPEEEVIIEKTFPKIFKSDRGSNVFIEINGIQSVLAKASDNITTLARKSDLTPEQFARYNDLEMTDKIFEGQIYYIKSKRNKAKIYYYTVKRGETLWEVSQKFGIKKSRLAKFNRMSVIDKVEPGRVLWLRKKRPEDVPVEIRELEEEMPVDETMPVKELVKNNIPVKIVTVPVDTPQITESDSIPVESNSDNEELVEEVKEVIDEVVDHVIEITEYTVQKGETLYSISKKTGVSVEDLKEWNDLYNNALAIGQTLTIHGNTEDSKKPVPIEKVTFHVVEPGDTMFGISRKYNVEVSDLLQWNDKENFDLSVGEKIRVRE